MTTHDRQEIDQSKFARSVARWIGIALPVAFVVLVGAVWGLLDVSLGEAVAIGAWPALLTGVFGGGFVGVVRGGK